MIEKLRAYAEATRWGGECRILHAHHGDFARECSDRKCDECRAEYLRAIADGMDAELRDAEARLMPDGMEWPRVDGEPVDFGTAYESLGVLEAVSIYSNGACEVMSHDGIVKNVKDIHIARPKVLDADGAEIRVGDELYSVEGGLKITVGFIDTANGKIATTEMHGLGKWADPSTFTHRRAILDANGLPIAVGKTYYGESDGAAWLVEGINAKNKSHPIVARNASKGAKELRPEWLTLEPPDTWERLYLDMDNGRMTVGEFERRCKALAEREAL